MPQYSLVGHVKLTQYSSYEQNANALERCPVCHNERIGKSPRRGPTVYHCRRCGFVANMNDIHGVRRMLGQKAA